MNLPSQNRKVFRVRRCAHGRHHANPKGVVRYPDRDELLNLHYKWLGLDYVLSRSALLRTGLGEIDRANKWGFHYDHSKA